MEEEKAKRPRSVLQQEQLAKARARALEVRIKREIPKFSEFNNCEIFKIYFFCISSITIRVRFM